MIHQRVRSSGRRTGFEKTIIKIYIYIPYLVDSKISFVIIFRQQKLFFRPKMMNFIPIMMWVN